ncbi:hypothetical protein FRC01_009212, partial [Tulasnella sp. 417]
MDLLLGGNSTHTPGYAVYKDGQPIKLALFNYITDPSGNNDAQFNFPSSQPSVRVKYFSTATDSTADKVQPHPGRPNHGRPIRLSDGRLQGAEQTQTVQCNPGTCSVTVKAPQFALVFLDNQDSIDPLESTQTWPTSVATKLGGTAVVDPSVLATSNGRGGAQEAFNIGGTSSGSQVYSSGAQRTVFASGALAGVVAMVDTSWPPESKKAVDGLLQTVNDLPDVPSNADATPLKDTLVEFIGVLEGTYTRVKEASEKHGRNKRGLSDKIKDKLSSGRRRRCTDTLWGCRAEIESASTELRNCLTNISAGGDSATVPVPGSGSASEIQPQSPALLVEADHSSEPPVEADHPHGPLVEADHHPEPLVEADHPPKPLAHADHPPKPLEPSKTLQTNLTEPAPASERPPTRPTSPQESSPDVLEDAEKRSPIRELFLTGARKTFQAVELASGAIPLVGDFVGVAAKVGLGFVNMIEARLFSFLLALTTLISGCQTMDSNEDVSKELTSHTEELASQLEHFKKNSSAQTGDQVTARIEKLR